jgi:hypothetical protein
MRRPTTVLSLALVIAAAACGSDGGTAPAASVSGAWSLTTVNGAPLPFTVRSANPKVEVVSDQITWLPDGTFAETGTARFTDTTGVATTSPYTDSGAWTLNGATITVRYASDGASLSGPVSGNSLTIAGFGLSQVYAKQ